MSEAASPRSPAESVPASLMAGFRVLDLTDEKGLMCGKVLRDLGAEVIKVEPPCGDAARNRPPFFHDQVGPDASLFYLAYNGGKKSVTINLGMEDGRALFRQLVATADFVLESFRPGYLDEIELGYAALSALKPSIVLTSISAFGQHGPYRDFVASDLVCTALSGYMYLNGDADRPPVHISVPQAYTLGGSEAAGATLVAHYARQRSGCGQHVDVAIRDAMIRATVNALPWWEHEGIRKQRSGPYWWIGREPIRALWPCKDGWVSFVLHGSSFGARSNRALIEWANAVELDAGVLAHVEWETLDMRTADPEILRQLEQLVIKLFARLTREEILGEGVARGIMVQPVQTIADIYHDPQLRARGYWQDIGAFGTRVPVLGAFIKASTTPLARPDRAPYIGEHNTEILVNELGLSQTELLALKALGAV